MAALPPSLHSASSFSFRSGRLPLVFDTKNGGTAVNHLVGHAWQQRSRSLTRASVSAGTNQVENNAWKLLWVRTGRAGFGTASREGRSLEREMHLARAGEIVLLELPDAAWYGTNCRGPSTQPHIPFGCAQGLRDLVNG